MLPIQPDPQMQQACIRATFPKLWLMLLAGTTVAVGVRSLQAHAFRMSPLLLIPLLTLILLHGNALLMLYWQRRTFHLQRQERVLCGDTSLLAVEQPLPDSTQLPAHIILSWRTRISTCLLWYLLIWLIMMALIIPFVLYLSPLAFVIGLFVNLGSVFVGIPVLLACFVVWQKYRGARKAQELPEGAEGVDETAPTDLFSLLTEQFVDVDENSLTVYAYGKGFIDIPWKEARLFCIVSGGDGPKAQRTYALMSDETCATWVDAPSHSFWPLRRYRPWLPDAHHQQKSQELLQYIVARTGLPLYDVRRERAM